MCRRSKPPVPIRAIRFGWRHRSRADNVLHSIFHQSFEQLVHDIIEVDAVQLRDVTPQLLRAGTWPCGDKPLSAADQVGRRCGANIVGYDPLWQDPAKARFKPRHFQIVHDSGFSSVRIVLMAFRFMNEKNELPAGWFATLDGLVNEALAQKLTVIIDEHDYDACGRDVVACRPRLMAFWRQVAEHYKDAPGKVVFEILNEPNEAINDVWNDVHAEAWPSSADNPTRNVIIGPPFWNNVGWLDELVLPKNDRHIIITVHYYLPMTFTPGRELDARVREPLRQHLGHARRLRRAR